LSSVELEPLGSAELYRHHAADVHRFALYLSGDRHVAEDVTAEAFVRAFSSAQPVRTATAKGYLLAIARNLVIEEVRRGRRLSVLDDEAATALPDANPGPEDAAAHRQRLERVMRAMRALPEVDRAALLLRAQEDLPYEEIAAVLGISVSAAKVKVHRA